MNDQAILNAVQAFVDANPAFRKDSDLADRMLEYIEEKQLPKTDVDSWQTAYDLVCRDSVDYNAGTFREDGSAEVYLDREAIDRMPADVMKQRLREPIFARGVNLLLENER